MTPLAKAAIFYAVAGTIIGLTVASMKTVNVNTPDGKPIPFARLLAFVICFAVWPLVFYQMVFGKND